MVLGRNGSLSYMNKGGIKGSGYVHGMSCISMIDSSEICNENGRFLVDKKVVVKENGEELKDLNTCSSSTTSSIGKNSDVSGRSKMENSGDIDEVQSSYKGPLDAMEALEKVLPIRRGISNFYNGKSKSFASLADASSSASSIKDIAKPDNAYIRKRRNQLACNLAWDNTRKTKSSPLRSCGGGVTKRVINSSQASLALAVTMSTSGIYNSKNENTSPRPNLVSGFSSTLLRTSLHPQFRDYHQSNGSSAASPCQNFSAWRSLSLADLQHCASVSAACTSPNPLDIKPS